MGQTHDDRQGPERADVNLYARAAVEADTLSEEDRSVEVIASTEDIDRHGTILRQNWRLDDYKRNPIVLYSHNRWDLPIGTASDIRVADGKLRAKLTFSTPDLNEEADRIWRNVKAKVIRGVSVGFWPHTVTVERHDDRDVVILDDNELFEISMTPVPSNPECLSQLRARALEARSTPAPVPQPTTAAPPSPPEPAPTPEQPEIKRMADDNKQTNNYGAIIAALRLLPGASETDMINRIGRLLDIEARAMALTGVTDSAQIVGGLQGLKDKADAAERSQTELTQVKGERDKQRFDGLIGKGQSERKLTPAEAKHYTDRFTAAVAEGRGAEAVAELEGYLSVAPRKFAEPFQQPPVKRDHGAGNAGAGPLTWNGKSYGDLQPMEKDRLSKEDPDLFQAMRADHRGQQRVA